uniref:Uncharacterized protein n=1 Tax=Sipha flava TaxID=143950 RepID=A0A2S2QBU3_9HEMI
MEVYYKKKAILAYLVHKKYVRTYDRRNLVHPFTDSRLLRGEFHTTFSDIRENPEKFFTYFRMSVRSFDELATKVSPKLISQDTCMRLSIPPLEKNSDRCLSKHSLFWSYRDNFHQRCSKFLYDF